MEGASFSILKDKIEFLKKERDGVWKELVGDHWQLSMVQEQIARINQKNEKALDSVRHKGEMVESYEK